MHLVPLILRQFYVVVTSGDGWNDILYSKSIRLRLLLSLLINFVKPVLGVQLITLIGNNLLVDYSLYYSNLLGLLLMILGRLSGKWLQFVVVLSSIANCYNHIEVCICLVSLIVSVVDCSFKMHLRFWHASYIIDNRRHGVVSIEYWPHRSTLLDDCRLDNSLLLLLLLI